MLNLPKTWRIVSNNNLAKCLIMYQERLEVSRPPPVARSPAPCPRQECFANNSTCLCCIFIKSVQTGRIWDRGHLYNQLSGCTYSHSHTTNTAFSFIFALIACHTPPLDHYYINGKCDHSFEEKENMITYLRLSQCPAIEPAILCKSKLPVNPTTAR